MTPDEIADALRLHKAEIVEADEWRPLAKHVSDLIRLAVRAELERLVPEVCEACRLEHKPIRHNFGGPQAWAHRIGGKPCPASPIHERLRADQEESQP